MGETAKEKYMREFEEFKSSNARFLCILNILTVVISAAFSILTFYFLIGPGANFTCLSLYICLWFVCAMHGLDAILALFNFLGLLGCFKCCCAACSCVFLLFQLGSLVYMHMAYFGSTTCDETDPHLYSWLFINLIAFYCVAVIFPTMLCLRKYLCKPA